MSYEEKIDRMIRMLETMMQRIEAMLKRFEEMEAKQGGNDAIK